MTAQGQGPGQTDQSGPGRGSQIVGALGKAAKTVWMPVSLVFYGLGIVFFNAGRFLMRMSGWRFGRKK